MSVQYKRGVGRSQGKPYVEFLKAKKAVARQYGFRIEPWEINPILRKHESIICEWAIRGGRRAIFASFGLGKTAMQLEIMRLVRKHKGGEALITVPLNVAREFLHDAHLLATGDDPNVSDEQRAELKAWLKVEGNSAPTVKFIRSIEDRHGADIYLTNYETVRDGKLDPRAFSAASLDEAAILRGFGGTKTFREFMRLYEGIEYKFVATATPSPNEFIELLAYSAYLGIMDVGQAKTRFFKRDSTKADKLTLHPHKESEFYMWLGTWSIWVTKPSDLGCSDDGYERPALDIRWHEVSVAGTDAGSDRDGQGRIFRNAALGVTEASREKRESIDARLAKVIELRNEDPAAHRVLWHDLEAERHSIERAIPGIASVYGSQDFEPREQIISDFTEGRIQELAAKPVMLGSGCNLQRHCHWAIFVGIGHKFNDIIQAIHRLQRFGQRYPVRIDFIYTEAEREIRRNIERKWAQHDKQRQKMTEIIKEFGLSDAKIAEALTRALGVERVEVKSDSFTLVNNDCVLETKSIETDSVGLIVTSIPFSTQYEYSPNYADFGHTDDNQHFFEQMDFLTPELLRVLHPGRLAAIHVKDRIVPGGMTGLGFQTLYPFHVDCILHYKKHGFAFMGMKTIVTDVVRENNQTYRLGWSEQCTDGTKMGFGVPEYLLLFRKPQSDTTRSYADKPVKKLKPFSYDKNGSIIPFDRNSPMVKGTGYSRTRWQIDAHDFSRSSGDRLLTPDELKTLDHEQIFRLFRDYSLSEVYNFEHHVKIGEELEASGRLPVTFMLLQPQSWHPDVWSDITRMMTLNSSQSAQGKEMHLCPLQFDIVDRAIAQWSNEGEAVLDPFSGLGTVPYRAVLKGRYGYGIELSTPYYLDAINYCRAAEEKINMPSLFDTLEQQAERKAV